MSRYQRDTRFNQYVNKALNHPVLSLLLFFCFCVAVAVGFWEKVEKYVPWIDGAESPRIQVGTQEGEITVTGLNAYDVYYQTPYSSPPNLVFEDGFQFVEQFELLEQRSDGFKVQIGGGATIGSKIKWKAAGTLGDTSK